MLLYCFCLEKHLNHEGYRTKQLSFGVYSTSVLQACHLTAAIFQLSWCKP